LPSNSIVHRKLRSELVDELIPFFREVIDESTLHDFQHNTDALPGLAIQRSENQHAWTDSGVLDRLHELQIVNPLVGGSSPTATAILGSET
jgi:hypothetical protein